MKTRIGFRPLEIGYQRDRGYHKFTCPKGLWEVIHNDYNKAMLEALHYYQQYAMDGEYDET